MRFRWDGIRWETVSDFRSTLEHVLESDGETVKESAFKQVTVHTESEGTYYIKRYRHEASLLRPLKFFWKASQARQEWELAKRLKALGIPVVRHVALGERWGRRGLLESILVTEEFPGRPASERCNLDPERLQAILDRLFDHGFYHPDLHAGNILVHPETGELRLVDLHGMRACRRVSSVRRRKNLAYIRITLPLPHDPEIEALSRKLRRKIYHARSRRCLGVNREFERQMLGGRRWQVRRPWLSEKVTTVLCDPDGLADRNDARLKSGRSSTVARSKSVVLKRYNFKKWLGPLKAALTGSRARHAFRKAYQLELTGIPTARPIAYCDEHKGPLVIRSFLLMEALEGAMPLPQFKGSRRSMLRQAGWLIGRLHDEGFTHRDLKASNILLDRDEKPYLIDLEGLRFRRNVSSRRAIRDLLRLEHGLKSCVASVPRARLVFLKYYCRTRGISLRELSAWQ